MISVCLGTYNGEKYIKEQILSILPQLSQDDELIISDDGSSDNTMSVVSAIDDKRIKVFENRSRHGFVSNFNNALEKAKGDIIFLCDQDDVWRDEKVEISCNYLKKYDLIVHDALIVDALGQSKGYTYFSTMHDGTGFLANLWKTRFLGCCMAFKREVRDYCLPIPMNVVAHDYWIGLYSLTRFKVFFVPDVLIYYRRHGENASPSTERSSYSVFYKLFVKRGTLLLYIVKRRLYEVLKN